MIVVRPHAVTDGTLTASNIPEPAAGETVWTAGTYTKGTRRIKTNTHRIYEVTADPSTSDDPEVGVKANPATWVDVGPVLRWAMFDQLVHTESANASSIDVTLTPGLITNGLAMFGVSAESVTVKMNNGGTEVYNQSIDLNDQSEVHDWYYYFFAPISRKTELVLTDLPAYPAATVQVIATAASTVKLGALTYGQQVTLGAATYGTSLQLLDFSRKERDEFGNFTIKRGRTSKLVDFDVGITRDRIKSAFNTLASLTTIPAVYFGGDGLTDDETLIYGYYRDSQINIDSPTMCSATITIEGLT